MQFLPFFLIAGLTLVHPLHISVTEITLDEKEHELEIMIRIFTDDLEQAIRSENKTPDLNILKPVNITTDDLIWNYLRSKFKLTVNGQSLPMKYLGHEKDDDVMVFYVQVQPAQKFEAISITNSILTELYDDQSNLVNVTVEETTKSLRLMRNNPSGKLSFE
jgi:hypothetical protein